MISMYTKQEIILKSYREGKSQRAISRELGISRKTVQKYIEQYEARLQKGESPEQAVSAYLATLPKYSSRAPVKLKLTAAVKSAIDKLLTLNEERLSQGLRKQLLKKSDIFVELQAQGFDIGYTTVCNYIRDTQGKAKPKEAYIRQVYEPGSLCEFDWGEVKLYINGVLTRLQLAVFTSAYSNYRFAILYQRQDTLAFMESHAAFFFHLKGVFKCVAYDNMRVAVAKFIGLHEKEPTEALLQLRGHYQFTHRFCNIYRGNEKGHVERSVEYVRRKSFGLKNSFGSVEEAIVHLERKVAGLNGINQQLTGKTANELLEHERKYLIPTTTKICCSEQVSLRVDKYATVSYKTCRYSVPDHLVGEFVTAKIMSHKIAFYHQDLKVATHPRNYGKFQWVVKIDHYLTTFKRKPGALAGSLALASSGYLKQLYESYFTGATRDFIELLSYCQKHGINEEKLQRAVARLKASHVKEITVEQLLALLGNKQVHFEPLPPTQITRLAKSQLHQLSALMQ